MASKSKPWPKDLPPPAEWAKQVGEQFVKALNTGAAEAENATAKKPRKGLRVVRIKRKP